MSFFENLCQVDVVKTIELLFVATYRWLPLNKDKKKTNAVKTIELLGISPILEKYLLRNINILSFIIQGSGIQFIAVLV